MNILLELEGIFRVLLSVILVFPIGYEREEIKKPAGLRTHMLISMGSAVFTFLSLHGFPGSDPSRMASYIVAGIGFVGAGAIIRERDKVVGVTTAASLWVSASIGISSGAGFYLIAVGASILTYLILRAKPSVINIFKRG
mgnify:CR=1 FL=1